MKPSLLLGLSLSLLLCSCSNDPAAPAAAPVVETNKAPAPAPAATTTEENPAPPPLPENVEDTTPIQPVIAAELAPTYVPAGDGPTVEKDVFLGTDSIQEADASKRLRLISIVIDSSGVPMKDRKAYLDEQESLVKAQIEERGDIFWAVEHNGGGTTRVVTYTQPAEYTRHAVALLATRLIDSVPAGKTFHTNGLGNFEIDLKKIVYHDGGTLAFGNRAIKLEGASHYRFSRFGKAQLLRNAENVAVGARFVAPMHTYATVEDAEASKKSPSSTVGLVSRGQLVVEAYLKAVTSTEAEGSSKVWIGMSESAIYHSPNTFMWAFGRTGWEKGQLTEDERLWGWEIPTIVEKAAK